ncbi:MAG: DUF1015 domain-containing protein [Bacteroidetes bacterium]|nr:DUF1015 domain-containing protein [Bacteroidota bacterium]
MRIRPFQAVYPHLEYITSPDTFFETIKLEYLEYYESGFYTRDAQDAFYLYQIKDQQRNYIGLVARASIYDYLEGKIKKHENTVPAKEQTQMKLLLRRKVNIKPLLLAYPKSDTIDKWIKAYISANRPFLEVVFEKGQQEHIIWEIKNGKDILDIQTLFRNEVPQVYIADGHHRISTVAIMHKRVMKEKKENPYESILSGFFAFNQLEIHEFNRVIEGLEEISLTTFMAKISQLFEIEILEKAITPTHKHEIIMYLNREWFRLNWRKEIIDSHTKDGNRLLDTQLLNEKVLKDILGIKDVRTDARVMYVEGPQGPDEVRKMVNKNEKRIGFCLYPIEHSDLTAYADKGKVLPPKSTWFEPRLKSGLLLQELL